MVWRLVEKACENRKQMLLRKTLGQVALTYEELLTVLCYCETVINSRPLICISDGIEVRMLLIPDYFLQDIRNGYVPDCDMVDFQALERKVRYRQKVSQNLRKRFRDEYLGQMVQTSKTWYKTESLKKGDVLLIVTTNAKIFD